MDDIISHSKNKGNGMIVVRVRCLLNLHLQSRPIEIRVTILYLANRLTKFRNVSSSNRILDLVVVLLQAFSQIENYFLMAVIF